MAKRLYLNMPPNTPPQRAWRIQAYRDAAIQTCTWEQMPWRPSGGAPDAPHAQREQYAYAVADVKDALRYLAEDGELERTAELARAALALIVRLETQKQEARLRIATLRETVSRDGAERKAQALRLLARTQRVELSEKASRRRA